MLIRRLVFWLLIPLANVVAQTPPPELRIEPVDGGSILHIKNVADQPLTGVLIELLNYPGSYYAFWQDDVSSEPMAAGAEKEIRITNMTVGAVPDYVKVHAAIYADGSSSGVAEKVTLLKERRRFELETMHLLIQKLEKAQAEGKPTDSVIADLKRWADSMELAGKPKRYSQADINQAATRALVGSVVAELGERSMGEVLGRLKAKER